MAEVITLSLALRPVRIEVDDAELAAELRAQSQGFVLPNDTEPWLSMRVTRQNEERDELKSVVVRVRREGRYDFLGPRSRGTYSNEPRLEARGTVTNIEALYQFIYLCLSMSLPREGGLLLHADTVEWKGGALVTNSAAMGGLVDGLGFPLVPTQVAVTAFVACCVYALSAIWVYR